MLRVDGVVIYDRQLEEIRFIRPNEKLNLLKERHKDEKKLAQRTEKSRWFEKKIKWWSGAPGIWQGEIDALACDAFVNLRISESPNETDTQEPDEDQLHREL